MFNRENQQPQDSNQETQKENRLRDRFLGSAALTVVGTGVSYLALEQIQGVTTSVETVTGIELKAPITKILEDPTLESVVTRIISPFSIVVNKTGIEGQKIKLVIGNSLNSANPSNPEEVADQQAELASSIEKQLSEQVIPNLSSTFGSKILAKDIESRPTNYTVEKKEIVGNSSFEFSGNGLESVKIGNSDKQNLDLSKLRAENVRNVLPNELKTNVKSTEVQPNIEEYNLILYPFHQQRYQLLWLIESNNLSSNVRGS
jgi:hypothetical protein